MRPCKSWKILFFLRSASQLANPHCTFVKTVQVFGRCSSSRCDLGEQIRFLMPLAIRLPRVLLVVLMQRCPTALVFICSVKHKMFKAILHNAWENSYTTLGKITAKYMWTSPILQANKLVDQLVEADLSQSLGAQYRIFLVLASRLSPWRRAKCAHIWRNRPCLACVAASSLLMFAAVLTHSTCSRMGLLPPS